MSQRSIFLYAVDSVNMTEALGAELRSSGYIPVGVSDMNDVRIVCYPEIQVDGNAILESAIKAMAPSRGKQEIADVSRHFVELLAELMFKRQGASNDADRND